MAVPLVLMVGIALVVLVVIGALAYSKGLKFSDFGIFVNRGTADEKYLDKKSVANDNTTVVYDKKHFDKKIKDTIKIRHDEANGYDVYKFAYIDEKGNECETPFEVPNTGQYIRPKDPIGIITDSGKRTWEIFDEKDPIGRLESEKNILALQVKKLESEISGMRKTYKETVHTAAEFNREVKKSITGYSGQQNIPFMFGQNKPWMLPGQNNEEGQE